MSKTYNKKKDEKRGAVRKAVSIIAAVLAIVIVAGVIISYNIVTGGFIQRHTVAMESENYEVNGAMMTYYFNTIYQQYVSGASSYLSYIGLDTTKSLKEQKTSDGSQTWYDYFMSQAKTSVEQMLVLCEAAKAEGFEVDGLKDEIDETVDAMKTNAKNYNVSFEYYMHQIYGSAVNERVLRRCIELSEIASHYSESITDKYDFGEDDWNKYFEDNKSSFLKVDWLTYTFTAEAETLGDNATEEEKEAAKTKQDEEFEGLKTLAAELKATTDADSFKAYVENYLRNVKYAGMDEKALEEDKVDIKALVDGVTKTGNTGATESDLNKWAFDEARKPYETYSEEKADSHTVTVYMILPAENTEDLGLACQYRDVYHLKNFRYIPCLISEDSGVTDEKAKELADEAYAAYEKDPTEDNFTKLASADEYGDGTYEGGLREGVDKGALSAEVDAWLYDSERKVGDCEIIAAEGKGYYVIYYTGDGEIKWQASANNSLMSKQYSEDYEALADKHAVSEHKKGLKMIIPVDLSAASSADNK